MEFNSKKLENYSMGLFVIPLSVFIPPRSFGSLELLGPTSLIALSIASFSSVGISEPVLGGDVINLQSQFLVESLYSQSILDPSANHTAQSF